jgi:hypothetical protein
MRRAATVALLLVIGLVACGNSERTNPTALTGLASGSSDSLPPPKTDASNDPVYDDLHHRVVFLTGPLRGIGDIAEVHEPSCACRTAEFRGRSLLVPDQVTAAAVKFGRDNSAVGVSSHPSDADGAGQSGAFTTTVMTIGAYSVVVIVGADSAETPTTDIRTASSLVIRVTTAAR